MRRTAAVLTVLALTGCAGPSQSPPSQPSGVMTFTPTPSSATLVGFRAVLDEPGPPPVAGTYVQVRGGPDADLVRRANATLRAPIDERLAAYRTPSTCAPGRRCAAAELDGPQLQFALLKDSLEVIVDTAYYGFETACGQPSAKIPFTELKGLLAEPVGG